MIKVTIDEKVYEVRNEWKDNTINDLVKPQEYINTLPQWLESYIYTDSKTPISEAKLLDFYFDWISLFSNIPKDVLENVKVKDEEHKHFAESNALSHLFQNKNYRKWEYIARITAILFRPDSNEQYNEDIIDQRTKEFGKLPVSEAYKGYFFLSNSLNSLQESTLISFQESKENLLTVNQRQSLKTRITKSKPSIWLKKVFSTSKD